MLVKSFSKKGQVDLTDIDALYFYGDEIEKYIYTDSPWRKTIRFKNGEDITVIDAKNASRMVYEYHSVIIK